MTGILRFLFSFTGRLSRQAIWRYYGAPLALILLITYAALSLSFTPATAAFVLSYFLVLLLLPLTPITLAIHTRRFHDVGLSAWWAAGLWAFIQTGLIAIWIAFGRALESFPYIGHGATLFSEPMHMAFIALIIATALAYLAFFFIAYLAPGDKGDNRFGAIPD